MKPEIWIGKASKLLKGLTIIPFSSWLNLLLLCIPVSWVGHFAWQHDTTTTQDTIIFIFSFLSIIPLAKLLASATDELSLRIGQSLGGLLASTLDNVVEFFTLVIALTKCELQMAQSLLIGSILVKLVPILGTCLLVGGTRFSEQGFSTTPARIQSLLLIFVVASMLLPTVAYSAAGDQLNKSRDGPRFLLVSRLMAIIFMFVYICYVCFQLFTHRKLYDEEHASENRVTSTSYPTGRSSDTGVGDGRTDVATSVSDDHQPSMGSTTTDGVISGNISQRAVDSATTLSMDATYAEHGVSEHSKENGENLLFVILYHIALVAIIAITVEFLVSSMNGFISGTGIKKEFVNLILLPIVGNAAGLVTAATVSVRDKLDLSLAVSIGASVQLVLFVNSLIITIAWIMNKSLLLVFDRIESGALFLVVVFVTIFVQVGKSHWLEGAILICLYVILAIVVFLLVLGTDVAAVLGLLGCTASVGV